MIDVYLENSQPKTFDYANSCSAKIISTTTDKDTDRDGCSDALEKAYGMDPTTPDMLACNISVAANYNDCSTVPVEVPSDAFLKLNFKANPTRFSDSEFLVPGSVSLSMDLELEDDEVCFAARDKDESRGLDYELGCYEVEYLNEIKGFDYNRKIANFAFMNNKDLADGEYRVLAYGQASNSTKVFDYQDIVIDRTAPTIPLELVEFAGLSADDVSKAKLIRLDPNSDQVYAVFKTNPNTAVEAYWNSILLTSNILADSTSGLAYVELPTWFDLESNETHKLTAYAYSLSDPSAISQTYSLEFKLNSKSDLLIQLLLLSGAITVIGGLLTLNRFRLKRSRQIKLN
jgi:hypothetical protein